VPTLALVQRADGSRFWIWIFAEIQGLRWVLEHNAMAFPERAATQVAKIRRGDRAVLYVSRNAFHNPTRDESRLVGLVRVTSDAAVHRLTKIGTREYSWLLRFYPDTILDERTGPPVRPLVKRLQRVKRPEVWGGYFRSSPIEIVEEDFRVLASAVAKATGRRC
jgi:hypothetical protein